MFLQKVIQRNMPLVEAAVYFHKKGQIQPDTYLLDVDTILENGRQLLMQGEKYKVELLFMSKQYGRNPLLSQKLMDIGFKGAVCVDYKEAQVLHKNGITIGHVGHLVQIPQALTGHFLTMHPQVWTVFSYEKALNIDREAKLQGIVQDIIIKVTNEGDHIYHGQEGGLPLNEVEEFAQKIKGLNNVRLVGATSFPCLLFDDTTKKIIPTKNAYTVKTAVNMLQDMGFTINHINMPSATSYSTIPLLAKLGANFGEPGHSLHGTTPLHAVSNEMEVPAIVYVSEVSHKYKGLSYFYGGGHYMRSDFKRAYIPNQSGYPKVILPSPESIDYYLGLEGEYEIGTTVVSTFRTQLFVTRSDVVLVEGLQNGKPSIIGIYDTLGKRI